MNKIFVHNKSKVEQCSELHARYFRIIWGKKMFIMVQVIFYLLLSEVLFKKCFTFFCASSISRQGKQKRLPS